MSWKWFIFIAVFTLYPAHVISLDEERGVIPCDEGWFYYKGICYRIGGSYNTFSVKKADVCNQNGEEHFHLHESLEQIWFMAAFLVMDWWIFIENQETHTLEWKPKACAEKVFQYFSHHIHTNYVPNSFSWDQIGCDGRGPYVCKKESDPTKKTPDPRFCSPEDGGGYKFQSSCYHVVKEKKTWDDAEEHCRRNFSGHLVTILDLQISIFLQYIISDLNDTVWIGIKITEQLQQKWSSGWHVSYDDGLTGLNSQLKDGLCVLARQHKTWILGQCSERHPFLCDTYKAPPVLESVAVNGSRCPTKYKGWRDLGGEFCYLFEEEKLPYYDATSVCKQRGGNLVSIRSKEENELLHPFLKYTMTRSFFIGLTTLLNSKNIFEWADGSELNYTNWDSGQPDNSAGKHTCTEVYKFHTSNMLWKVVDCRTKNGFICSTRKALTEKEDSENNSYKNENTTGSSMMIP